MLQWGDGTITNNLNVSPAREFRFATYNIIEGHTMMDARRLCNILLMVSDEAFAERACMRMMGWLSYVAVASSRYATFIDQHLLN